MCGCVGAFTRVCMCVCVCVRSCVCACAQEMEGGVPVGSDGDAAANSDPIQLSSAFLVDWYVLLLVGVACLLTKALHRLAAMLCPLVRGLCTYAVEGQGRRDYIRRAEN